MSTAHPTGALDTAVATRSRRGSHRHSGGHIRGRRSPCIYGRRSSGMTNTGRGNTTSSCRKKPSASYAASPGRINPECSIALPMYSVKYGGMASANSSRVVQSMPINSRAIAIGAICPAMDITVPGFQ